jgi:hypothetical protein
VRLPQVPGSSWCWWSLNLCLPILAPVLVSPQAPPTGDSPVVLSGNNFSVNALGPPTSHHSDPRAGPGRASVSDSSQQLQNSFLATASPGPPGAGVCRAQVILAQPVYAEFQGQVEESPPQAAAWWKLPVSLGKWLSFPCKHL